MMIMRPPQQGHDGHTTGACLPSTEAVVAAATGTASRTLACATLAFRPALASRP